MPCFRYHWRIIIIKFNSIFSCFVKRFNIIQNGFLLFWSIFLFYFFISPRSDLNFIWSIFASAILILPSFILLIKSRALSNSLNFKSAVGPLHLYIKSSELTFLSNLIISSSLSSTCLLNFSFYFEISGIHCNQIFWLF